MKKNKILIVILFFQFLLIGSVQAKCDLESFRFGISHKALISQLKLDDYFIESEQIGSDPKPDISREVVIAPGEKVCKNEKIFKDFPVEFLLLDDKLVEIRINRLSESPIIIKWAESIYGKKQNKPNSFYSEKPIAHWFWENSNALIIYSIESYENEVFELMIIQSLKHQKYFDKLSEKI